MQGRYLANSKWAPCEPDEQALAEDAERSRINNVSGKVVLHLEAYS